MFAGHHHETLSPRIARLFRNSGELRIDLWNAFVDSGLLGICDDDCSVIPRVLPLSYLPVIRQTCQDFMWFLMRFLSLPEREIAAILPPTPITDYLIGELGLFKYRPRRLTGSLRFDMAVVGRPSASNPPKLLEVNEIGFDGTGRSSFIQETLLRIVSGLREQVVCLDTAASELANMRRLGRDIVRFHGSDYNWEEEVLLAKAPRHGVCLRLVSPTALEVEIDADCPRLARERVVFRGGRLSIGKDRQPPDACQFAYSFDLKDYQEAPEFFRNLIRSTTPQYSPFWTALIAPKTILAVLSDKRLVRRLVGAAAARRLEQAILPASLLEGREEEAARRADRLVCKFGDGMGGTHDYIGRALRRTVRKIPREKRRHWILQERVHLNTIGVHGILSRPRRVIADLGAYIHYDWDGRRFTNLRAGGFITRATNRSLKVNVSGGGIQVPVMFEKNS